MVGTYLSFLIPNDIYSLGFLGMHLAVVTMLVMSFGPWGKLKKN